MHAYLITGITNDDFEEEITSLAKKLNAKIYESPLLKVEDARNLNDLIRLSFSEPTLIVSKNIHEATIEALNAFLKNLEEPQENIYFALTSPTPKKVLSTIVSRCQIIKCKNEKSNSVNLDVDKFLTFSPGQRFAFFDKIRDRGTAISFIEDLIFCLKEKREFENIEILIKTLTGLKANGNVNLHLANLAIKYGN